jgi:uncharacterized ferritin-like protein (DUF455 family)
MVVGSVDIVDIVDVVDIIDPDSVYQRAYQALMLSEVDLKAKTVFALLEDWRDGRLSQSPVPVIAIPEPGRPERPVLVAPRALKHRRLGSVEGKAGLLHAIAHIEFNAINLALDAVYRFQQMPAEFIDDWLGVAVEEAYHFQLVREQLARFGQDYGDLPAHDGLWRTTHDTAFDVLVRMALVPRTLEARGLDVTPEMMRKLRAVGEVRAVDVLHILLRDEIGHVAVGTKWFAWLCAQRGLNRLETFQSMIETYLRGDLRGPFNLEARKSAGFSDEELEWLVRQDAELASASLTRA